MVYAYIVSPSSCIVLLLQRREDMTSTVATMADLYDKDHVIQLGVRLRGITIENVWRVQTVRYKGSYSS